jgi:DNA modification methylase
MDAPAGKAENMLYYGDNLDILRRYIKDETIDLIYLDPPFKSNQDYNVLFAEKNGSQSAAQIRVFTDTWKWDSVASRTYEDLVTSGGRVADAMEAFRRFLGPSDMLAYLSMMAPRLSELRRTLKQTGSIYLHCDSTASHYLKMLMDSVFGPRNFRNEIIWKRKTGRGETQHKSNQFGSCVDHLLFYAKTDDATFNTQFIPVDEADPTYVDYVATNFKFVDADGRKYRSADLSSPSPRPKLMYTYKGYAPPEKGWAVSLEKMQQWDKDGRLLFPENNKGRIRRKLYLDELKGKPVQDLWDDIQSISSQSGERLGYPTQKPETLLERIIRTSSNDGDLVLDPFCGCGTTISVAQRLNRRWIGIDITHLAITLMRHRLKDAFGDSVRYKVIGEPVSLPDAENLAQTDPYQFQWWALGLVGARPVEQRKGADKGIDGRIFFFVESGVAEQMIFSVKAGNVTSAHVRDLHGVVDREKAAIGVLLSLNEPTQQMRSEAADAGFYTSKELGNPKYPKIQLLTVEQLLKGEKIECPHSVSAKEVNPTFKKAPKAKREPKQKEKQSKLSEHT